MNWVWKPKRALWAAGVFCAVSSATLADGVSEKEIAGVDNRYAIASEHFGDGQVQVNTRSASGEKNTYEIYSFSCVEGTSQLLSVGDELASDFPVQDHTHTGTEIDWQSETAAIATHACEEHGYTVPGLE